jgi:hypothetical protein
LCTAESTAGRLLVEIRQRLQCPVEDLERSAYSESRDCWLASTAASAASTLAELKSIEHQGGLHGGIADALVPPSTKGLFWIREKPRAA